MIGVGLHIVFFFIYLLIMGIDAWKVRRQKKGAGEGMQPGTCCAPNCVPRCA